MSDEHDVAKNDDVTSSSPPVQKEKTANKQKVKRKKNSGNKPYFTSDTQAAIVAYQQSESPQERSELYVTRILPAFAKLTENLINIHRFTSLYDSYEDLKSDCVNFLFETIRKFDGTRGTNAFSYFNVVAKNFLIIKTKQKNLKIKRNVSIDDPEALTHAEMHIIEDHCTIPSQDTLIEKRALAETTLRMMHEIRDKVKTENELTCVNSIITIFENIDNIDLLNKSAILLYMRELSGLSPKQLTTTMQSLKRYYRKVKIDSKHDEECDK